MCSQLSKTNGQYSFPFGNCALNVEFGPTALLYGNASIATGLHLYTTYTEKTKKLENHFFRRFVWTTNYRFKKYEPHRRMVFGCLVYTNIVVIVNNVLWIKKIKINWNTYQCYTHNRFHDDTFGTFFFSKLQ